MFQTSWSISTSLGLRPSNRLSLSANVSYKKATDDLQYVATAASVDGSRWILGRIDQDVWNITFRANLAVTPELTVQYYGSPFIATGRYADFKKATRTLAEAYEDRFHRYSASEIAYRSAENRYDVTESSTNGNVQYSFDNPDFSFQQFRSNLVVRWEYKPGSSLYFVWSQGRTGYLPTWNRGLGDNWNDLWRTPADNIVLVKVSYWFTL